MDELREGQPLDAQLIYGRLVERSSHFNSSLSWNQRLYLLFIMMGVVYIVLTMMTTPERMSGLLSVVFGIGILAAALDFYRTGAWLLESLPGKALLSLLYFATTTAAIGAAGRAVNETIGMDTVELTLTRNIVAVLLIPTFAAIASIFLALVAVPIATMYCMVSMIFQNVVGAEKYPLGEKSIPFPTLIFRLIAMSTVLHCLQGDGINNFGFKPETIRQAASWFAYNFEAIKYTRCDLALGQVAVKGEDREYLIISKQESGYHFEPRVCE